MPKYVVHMQMTLSTSVEVEAPDEDAAAEAAFQSDQMPPSQICAQCSGWGQRWSVDNGEWDLIDHEEAVALVDNA